MNGLGLSLLRVHLKTSISTIGICASCIERENCKKNTKKLTGYEYFGGLYELESDEALRAATTDALTALQFETALGPNYSSPLVKLKMKMIRNANMYNSITHSRSQLFMEGILKAFDRIKKSQSKMDLYTFITMGQRHLVDIKDEIQNIYVYGYNVDIELHEVDENELKALCRLWFLVLKYGPMAPLSNWEKLKRKRVHNVNNLTLNDFKLLFFWARNSEPFIRSHLWNWRDIELPEMSCEGISF